MRIKNVTQLVLALTLLEACATGPVSTSIERVPNAVLASPDALMCPSEGEEAFNRLYEIISNAKSYAHITAYSWSDGGLDKAIEKALSRGAKVRVVLHPDLKDTPKVNGVVPKLEAMGAEFKFAPMNMHEKFTVVDDEVVVNTSANFSGGAKTKYSENMVFHELSKDNSSEIKSLISDFKNEFTILWNGSKDIFTKNEAMAPRLSDLTKKENIPSKSNISLYSSSMNWTTKENTSTSQAYKTGKYISLVKKTYSGSAEQTWIVRDVLLDAIKNAKKSIYLSLNHFNIRVVSDALIEAVKRGVDVRLAVDNQEYKSRTNDLEMSPQFVEDWAKLKGKTLPPVRVKYYSHEPSPRYWLLNHHKFVLVDYELANDAVLLSGSYNLSRTAEQNQFDNLVVYRGAKYNELFKSFYKEFLNQWSWNRTSDDLPKEDVLALFFETKNNSYPVHVNAAVSLTWPEVMKLRADVNKKAPGIFSGLTKNRDCMYYDPTKKAYWACPNGN